MKNILLCLIMYLLNWSLCSAEIIKVQAFGEYTMSKYETLDIAQQRALLDAQKMAVEKAGVYVRSITQVENSTLVFDEIISVASNIIKITQKNFSQGIDSAGNIFVHADITAEVDSDSVQQGLQRSDLADIVQNYKILQAENEILKSELGNLKNLTTNKKTDDTTLQSRFVDADKQFKAHQLAKEALALEYAKDYKAALEKYNQIISLFPQSTLGHFQRGLLYRTMKKHLNALQDFDIAVANLNDSFTLKKELFLFRGIVEVSLRQDFFAIADFNRVLALDSNFVYAYVLRATSYYRQKQYQQAYDDADKAITLLAPSDKIFLPSMQSLKVASSAKLK